ncbi:hypothetical protein BANRA_00143 [Acinetobacter baumannii]|nr:hypothetical protein BANRA_00143 [Acinetobacter baumannii]
MLETDRLILKPFVQENLSTVIEMLQDKDFMAFSPYGDLTTEAAKTRF